MLRATQECWQRSKMNYVRRVLYGSVMAWLLLTPYLWGQGQSLRRPVGSELLRDGGLIVESCNFAIATPAGEWRWFVAEGQEAAHSRATYVCAEAAGGAELCVRVMDVRMGSGSKFMTGFKDGVEKSLTGSGLKVVSMDIAESSTPSPGSYHCQWHALVGDGTPVYGYIYVTGGEVSYALHHIAPDASEPPAFTEFVRSFRLLHTPLPRPLSGSGLLGIGYVLLVCLACAVAEAVNRVSGKVVLNGGTLGAVLVVVVMIVLIVVGNFGALSAGMSSENLGQITGRRMGEAFIPLLIAVLASRSFRKRKRHQEVALKSPDCLG